MFDLHVQTLGGLAARTPDGTVDELWAEAERLGYSTATLPVELGGGGGSAADGAEIARAAGHVRFGAPVALAAVVLGPLLEGAGWQPRAGVPTVVVDPRGRRTTCADFGVSASTAYVVGADGSGTRVAEIDLDAPGALRAPGGVAEPDHVARLGLGAPAVREARLQEPLEHWQALAALAAAVQIDGAVATVVAHTVDHLRTRIQFGKQLISFQALQHRVAELVTRAELLSHAVDEAVQRWDASDTDATRAAAVAKVEAGTVGLHVVAEAHQLHGAIGYTEESGLGEFSKLIWSQNERAGTCGWWSAWLGRHDRESADLWSRCAPSGTAPAAGGAAGDWRALP